MPGLCHLNELVMRDEGQHMDFACKMYRVLDEHVPEIIVHGMVREAVELEQDFFEGTIWFTIVDVYYLTLYAISGALPVGLRGIDTSLMDEYVEYVADFLLWRLGFACLYGRSNPVSCRLPLI